MVFCWPGRCRRRSKLSSFAAVGSPRRRDRVVFLSVTPWACCPAGAPSAPGLVVPARFPLVVVMGVAAIVAARTTSRLLEVPADDRGLCLARVPCRALRLHPARGLWPTKQLHRRNWSAWPAGRWRPCDANKNGLVRGMWRCKPGAYRAARYNTSQLLRT